jgi:hypothetical protein
MYDFRCHWQCHSWLRRSPDVMVQNECWQSRQRFGQHSRHPALVVSAYEGCRHYVVDVAQRWVPSISTSYVSHCSHFCRGFSRCILYFWIVYRLSLDILNAVNVINLFYLNNNSYLGMFTFYFIQMLSSSSSAMYLSRSQSTSWRINRWYFSALLW